MRVLVVDDSAVIRKIVSEALADDPQIEVVGTAANGRFALGKVAQLRPDVLTMDIEMPEMDGIATVRALRAQGYQQPIVMFSTLTEAGAKATLDALAAGASDYVPKPSGVGSFQEARARAAADLLPRIKALAARTHAHLAAPPAPIATRVAAPASKAVRAVLIGSSTGGPEALAAVVRSWSAPLNVPVLIAQHMPAVFTAQLAARLDRTGVSRVVEAAQGQPLVAGTAYVAPGGKHLEIASGTGPLTAHLSDAPPVNYCKPSVDVLFASAARRLGGDALVVMLTGMGSDGRDGSRDLVEAGATLIAQDQASSVVWGMPGAVVAAGLAHKVLPLTDIGSAVADHLRHLARP